MTSMAKKISDLILVSDTATDFKPDLAAYKKLKRSWEQHEKRKLQQALTLQKELNQIQQKMERSVKSFTKLEYGDQGVIFKTPPIAPGFRYKANGDERTTSVDTRKNKLVKSFSGLSKHTMDRKSQPGDFNYSSRRLMSMDDINLTEDSDMPSISSSQQIGRKASDEKAASSDRVRKVQEQLGLNSLVSPHHLVGNVDDKEVEQLEHALKVLHRMLSNPNIDRELLQEPEKYNLMSRPDLIKPLQILGSSRPVLGARGSGHVPIRERCQACQHVYRSEISELVKHSDPYTYKKPRWRLAPSGHYVAPPLKNLKIYYPSLFSRAEAASSSGSSKGKERPLPSTSPSSPKERYKESSSDQYFPFLRQVMEMSPHSPRGLPVSMPATPTNRPAASTGRRDLATLGQFDTLVSAPLADANNPDEASDNGVVTPVPKDGSGISSRGSLSMLKIKNSEDIEQLELKIREFFASLPKKKPTSPPGI